MGEQRPAIITNEVEDDLLDRPPAEIIVHLHPADDLTAEDPQIYRAVLAQGLARQRVGQHFAQERLEAFHYPQPVWNVAFLIRPTAWPLIEIRAVALQGIGDDLLRWQAGRPTTATPLGPAAMRLISLLKSLRALSRFRVQARAALRTSQTIEIFVRPRRGSRPVCSGCHKPAAAYDHLSLRRFEFVPLWGCMVVLLYCMRRVDCRACGVRVEAVPWGIGKHQLTKAYMLFLAHWARKLAWQETAVSFRTTWDKVCRVGRLSCNGGSSTGNWARSRRSVSMRSNMPRVTNT